MRKIYLFFLILAMPFIVISCKESSSTSPTTTTATTSTTTTTSSTTVEAKPVVIRETGEGFDNIQDAIDTAEDGNHIDVSVGTYLENLVIEKQLYLTGEERNTTIIDGAKTGPVVIFKTDSEGSDIRGFTIKNSGSSDFGMRLQVATLTVGRNVVKNNTGAILCYNFSGSISGVLITNNSNYGITVNGGAPLISETTVQDALFGIYCNSSSTASFSSCNVSNNNSGIMCDSGANPDLGGGSGASPGQNTIRTNTAWDLENRTANAIKAENNRWTHTTASDIDTLDIYDDDEYPSYGAVDFFPFLTGASFSSLRVKPRLLTASSLFKDFFRSLFRSDLPASAMWLSTSAESRIRHAQYRLMRLGYHPLTAERYYPPLVLRDRR